MEQNIEVIRRRTEYRLREAKRRSHILEGQLIAFSSLDEVIEPNGAPIRLIDEVDVITGVSGGSFTALAFGLYGDKLFDIYETSFLKRDVQGELIKRVLSPRNWGELWSNDWTRSEVAAQLYDEILFHGGTFADLMKRQTHQREGSGASASRTT